MDEFDEIPGTQGETIDGIEIGELLDIDGSAAAVEPSAAALDDSQKKKAVGKSGRPLSSIVHFEMKKVNQPDGTKKWKCNWCGALYFVDKKNGSTSSGVKHLRECLQRRLVMGGSDKDPSQSKLNLSSDVSSPNLTTWQYNHPRVREIASHMVLGHEFSFSIMEGVIFNKFLKEIYPGYQKISRHTNKKDCQSFYQLERTKMKNAMTLVNRISLTTDLWWSGEQKIGYMTVTAHFIDSKWQLHKRVLAFTNVPPPHSGEVIARELIRVMDDWRIREKVVSISVDNASANDNCIARLKVDFSNRRNLPLNGKLFHVRCCAHILNLLVQDGLDIIRPVIDKIRLGVKYILSSEGRCKAFKRIVNELQLKGRLLVLDTKTRWNSTWLMMSTAYFYNDVFPRYAEENVVFEHFLPDELDWEMVYDVCQFLELFADVTEIISGSTYPTSNLFLAELFRINQLLTHHILHSEKPHLHILAVEMKSKYDKYWSESNILISLGAVLDPRYKMVFINWVYKFLYPDGDDARKNEVELEEGLFSLFKMYEDSFQKPVVAPNTKRSEASSSKCSGLGQKTFEQFLESVEGSDGAKSDLQVYLSEKPILVKVGGNKFDVLLWWMGNELKYPILSKMAKDILSIPVTTVSSEATFSAGKRVIDSKRASMLPETVEMFICGGDWVKEMYGIKKGHTQSILEEEVEVPLEYNFGDATNPESSAT